jgi:hypothetical protein
LRAAGFAFVAETAAAEAAMFVSPLAFGLALSNSSVALDGSTAGSSSRPAS